MNRGERHHRLVTGNRSRRRSVTGTGRGHRCKQSVADLRVLGTRAAVPPEVRPSGRSIPES
jgi:hypothetical protein